MESEKALMFVLFFHFKGNIGYEIIGDSTAKNFFTVDRFNGQIRANINLKDDPLKNTQYNVRCNSNFSSTKIFTSESQTVKKDLTIKGNNIQR